MLQQLIPLRMRTGETPDKGNKDAFLLGLPMTQYRRFKREAIKLTVDAEGVKILNKVRQGGNPSSRPAVEELRFAQPIAAYRASSPAGCNSLYRPSPD